MFNPSNKGEYRLSEKAQWINTKISRRFIPSIIKREITADTIIRIKIFRESMRRKEKQRTKQQTDRMERLIDREIVNSYTDNTNNLIKY